MSRQDEVTLGLSIAGLLAFAIGRVVHRRRESHNGTATIKIEK